MCVGLTAGVVTRLEQPVFTQVYYAQNNDRQDHVLYFYLIRNVEDRRGTPFYFCFPQDAALACRLQPVSDYGQYSSLMEQESRKWHSGRRIFGRYQVELLQLCFTIPEEALQQGALCLTEGKIYFSKGYYQNLQLGEVLIAPAGSTVGRAVPQQSMAYISIGDFSERPCFSNFGQVWAYLQSQGAV